MNAQKVKQIFIKNLSKLELDKAVTVSREHIFKEILKNLVPKEKLSVDQWAMLLRTNAALSRLGRFAGIPIDE